MDENKNEVTPETVSEEIPAEPKPEGCTPRPAWQVWGARIALVIFILYVIMYYINIMRGGS